MATANAAADQHGDRPVLVEFRPVCALAFGIWRHETVSKVRHEIAIGTGKLTVLSPPLYEVWAISSLGPRWRRNGRKRYDDSE
jgi:hypothetical protein